VAIAPISLGFHSGLQHLVLSSNPESTPLWVVGGRREVPCSPTWVVLWCLFWCLILWKCFYCGLWPGHSMWLPTSQLCVSLLSIRSKIHIEFTLATLQALSMNSSPPHLTVTLISCTILPHNTWGSQAPLTSPTHNQRARAFVYGAMVYWKGICWHLVGRTFKRWCSPGMRSTLGDVQRDNHV